MLSDLLLRDAHNDISASLISFHAINYVKLWRQFSNLEGAPGTYIFLIREE